MERVLQLTNSYIGKRFIECGSGTFCKENIMASAITLKGIERAVSQLGYTNENSLKYRFIQYIRNYYVDENYLASLKKIDHTALIKQLWDTHDDPEVIKNKRKNLNSLRSSVNADLIKLYNNGLNPEGIKIGSDNIFVMSEDAKDNILNSFGFELQPDGTLKLDQIMDILKLANETVSGALGFEDTTTTDGFRTKDQLKDLIKGLSEKLGLGNPQFEAAGTGQEGRQSEYRVPSDGMGKTVEVEAVDEDTILSDLEDIEEEEVLEEVADSKENEILEVIEGADDDYILDDADENIVMDDMEDSNPEMDVEDEALDEDIEDVKETDTELQYVDVVDDDLIGGSVGGEQSGEFGTGVGDISVGLTRDQGLGQGKSEYDHDETGLMTGDSTAGIEAGNKGGGEGIAFDIEGKGDESGSGVGEINKVIDGAAPDEAGEIMELDDLDEIESIDEEDKSDVIEDIMMDDIDDSDPETEVEKDVLDEHIEDVKETDTELQYVDVVDDDLIGGSVGGEQSGEFGSGGDEKEVEQLGLPVDSLGQAYGSGKDGKLKKEKLLAEAFDGYLGSMDRYYNHYILIDGGEYPVGNRDPKKDEKPAQIVRLNPFYFGRFPVTNGLFEIFVQKTGYRTTAEKIGYGTVYYGRFEKKTDDITGLFTSRWNSSLYCKVIKGACWFHPTGPESALHNKRNHPVVQISLEDAAAFAAWTGKRLPTENEWEAASRAANGWIFPWGNEWKSDACNIEESGIADTTPVDKYSEFENDFGIVDVLGNVLEWTSDGFKIASQENYGAIYQIVKGGSWVSGNDIRLYCRFKLAPDSHSNILGFRCVAY
jgi:formylglycine-generating enzyme required for sulfatase activity